MIECKTYGTEYKKAFRETINKKNNQLFSYFQQDKQSTDYLCLYSSRLHEGKIERRYGIIDCNTKLKEASNAELSHELWNKQFKESGLFEDHIEPYDFKPSLLTTKSLRDIKEADSGVIFHGFMEILRHNVISDKANAFNKIFNLFLCKLHDEQMNDEQPLEFQYREGETLEDFILRLNELYASGIKEYLNKEIVNLTKQQIDDIAENQQKGDVRRKLREALLYKNNEFAFIDIYDKESFEENAKIVREIVELLQTYRIRYTYKQQFLGDFFELLINTGFKQESGQFLTPIPLARFVINSIPLKEITQQKLDDKESDFLPFVIDYAMGTGHFLTEAMDELQNIIDHGNLKPSGKNIRTLGLYKDYHFEWAKEFVYGIDRDYRLVKTAKVACFLNGDGMANIIHGDGLDSFNQSKHYKDKLQSSF
jgi:type I restriction enzyme M protein